MDLDEQVDPLDRDHSLHVVLPGGLEKTVTVHGSKPVMDFLVTMCAGYHLNPSDYTVEALSANKNFISFKANSPVGLLEAEKIILKPKAVEEKLKRPYVPEATVRLLINYNKSHKTVVRVSPQLPLELLLPAVCDKCEFQVDSTVLLRDAGSDEPLDLSKTLNQLGLRDVFARDTAAPERGTPERGTPETPRGSADIEPPQREKKQKENSGFFSLFRRKKKKQEAKQPPTAPVAHSCNTLPADLPKKKRAPQPPAMAPSLSLPNSLSSCHFIQGSGDSTLRSTKRKAPPPPCASPLQELQTHSDVTAPAAPNTLKSLREGDDSLKFPPASPRAARPLSSSRSSLNHLHQAADSCLPAFRGNNLSEAGAALAKVLTSSVSKGTLIRRLRKLPHGSPFMSAAPRSSGSGVFCSEFESVFTSDLPTESNWEDWSKRRGLTTFKVVPLKTPDSPPEEENPEVPQEETSPSSKTEVKDNPSSSDGSDPASTSPEPPETSPPLQDSHRRDRLDSPRVGQEEENQPEDSDQIEPAKQEDKELGPTGTQTDSQHQDRLESPQAGQEEEDQPEEEDQVEPAKRKEEGLRPAGTQTDSQHQDPSGGADPERWSFHPVGGKVQEEEMSFPPPPPPLFFEDEKDGAEPTTEPSSPTRKDGPTPAVLQRSQSALVPSRFAQAVAKAVQRSRRFSQRKSSAPEVSGATSPPTSTFQSGS